MKVCGRLRCANRPYETLAIKQRMVGTNSVAYSYVNYLKIAQFFGWFVAHNKTKNGGTNSRVGRNALRRMGLSLFLTAQYIVPYKSLRFFM